MSLITRSKYRILTTGALTVLFALLLIPPTCRAGILYDRVVAVVNSEAITWSELYRAMGQEIRNRFGQVSRDERMAVMRNSESTFLEGMIDKSLLLQEARKKGVIVQPEEVSRAIQSIRQENFKSEEDLINTIREEGFTIDEYRARISEQILTSRLTQQEVLEKIRVTEEDISRYLKENGIQSRIQYRIRQIFIGTAKDDQGAAVQKAEEIQGRLASGEDFGELAMAYSEGPAREAGGYLGYVNLEQLSVEFGDALKGMSPGDTARIRTPGGLHIIKLEEVRDVQEAIKEAMFQDRYGRWLKELRDSAYIEIKL